MILYKVFQRNKRGILASVIWYGARACKRGLVYDTTLSEDFLDNLEFSRARREGQVFFPPEGWGPFAAFDTLKHARAFVRDMRTRITTWEIWKIEAQPSRIGKLWTPKGLLMRLSVCPEGTVLVDSFKLLARVDVKQTEVKK